MASEGKDYRPLWVGIIVAVVTAIFTFMGNFLFHYFTVDSAVLLYSTTQSPSLPTSDGFKEIYVVNARNSGRREVENLMIRVSGKEGKLEQGSWRASEGIAGQETLSDTAYQVLVPFLNPGEHVSVATIMTMRDSDATPDVVVRAVGITGVKEDVPSSQPAGLNLLAPITAAIGALLAMTTLAFSWRLKSTIRGITGEVGPSRRECLTYISYACGIGEEAEKIRFRKTRLLIRNSQTDCYYAHCPYRRSKDIARYWL